MQAVILSGGQGTRLRPLTSTTPKPAVPMVNRPMIWYMVDWLARHGVDDVVMSLGFLADGLRSALEENPVDGVTIRYVEEPEPLGTAGAVRYTADHLDGGLDERFLVLNGDVLTDFDISAELAQHERTGARATLALVPVEDPSAYGLVLTDDEQRVEAFLEKPKREDAPPDPRINAGAYVLEHDVLDLIPPGQNTSFENDVFPKLVGNGIYGFDADGYWLDLGTPERYREATRDLLENNLQSYLSEDLASHGRSVSESVEVSGCEVEQNVALDHGCLVGAGATIGRHSVLGRDVVIGAGAKVLGSVLMNGVQVGEDASIDDAILGPDVSVGAEAIVERDVVIGAGARIAPGARVASGSRIDAAEQVAA